MAIETLFAPLETLKHNNFFTDDQVAFILRIGAIAYTCFPDLDQSSDTLLVCKKGIELTNKYGVRAFYFKDQHRAYYYQYQFSYFYVQCIEPTKAFELFSDKEIRSLLKRKRYV